MSNDDWDPFKFEDFIPDQHDDPYPGKGYDPFAGKIGPDGKRIPSGSAASSHARYQRQIMEKKIRRRRRQVGGVGGSDIPCAADFNAYMRDLAPDFWVRLDEGVAGAVKNYGESEGVNKDTGVDRLQTDFNNHDDWTQTGHFCDSTCYYQTTTAYTDSDAGLQMTISAASDSQAKVTMFVMFRPDDRPETDMLANTGISGRPYNTSAVGPSSTELFFMCRATKGATGEPMVYWEQNTSPFNTTNWEQRVVDTPNLTCDGATWHAAVVRWADDTGVADLWVDSVKVDTVTTVGTTLNNSAMNYIGRCFDATSDANGYKSIYHGALQHICVWDGTHLTDQEIEDLFEYIGLTTSPI